MILEQTPSAGGAPSPRPHPVLPTLPRTSRTALAGALLASLVLSGCDFFGQEPDEPPQAVGRIEQILLPEGRSAEVDVSGHFRDPEGEGLTFDATSSTPVVASVTMAGSVVTVSALMPGAVTVVVTAMDPAGQSGQQAFDVIVPATPVIQLAAPWGEGPEADGATFPLTLSVSPAVAVTVRYTLGTDSDDETADADENDFATGATGSLEIAAGATEASIQVAFLDDDEIEPAREHFAITLDDPADDDAYRLGAAIRGTGAIAEGVCDRTPIVRDAILEEAGMESCAAMTDEELSEVRFLLISPTLESAAWRPDQLSPPTLCDDDPLASPRITSGWSLPDAPTVCASAADESNAPPAHFRSDASASTALKSLDFHGLDNLFFLGLLEAGIETLPADVFANLTGLYQLAMVRNPITTLPEGLFSDLESLGGLILQANQLTALPEDMFAHLGGLEQLLLDFNQLTTIPDGISALENLVTLSAAENQLQSLPAEGPRGLFALYLGDNELAEVPTGWLAASPRLNALYLNGNRIADLSVESFAELPELQTLYIFDNHISAVPAGTFAHMSSLKRMILAENRITTLPSGAFAGLDSLEWLVLDNNRIGTVPANTFAGLESLTRLWLSANPIEELQPGAFAGMGKLELLSLGMTRLSTFPHDAFAGLAALEILSVVRNRLTELPQGMLAQLGALKRLYAGNNRIESLPDGFFLGHPGLQVLELADNPGAPFTLELSVARTDEDNDLAAGPATITGRLATGSPFDLKLPLATYGGRASANALQLRAGSEFSEAVTVTLESGQAGTQVSAGPLPRIPAGFTGLTLEIGDPIVLFGRLDNHPPVAVREIAAHRMRVGGDDQLFDGSRHFRDLDGDALSYTFELSDPAVASVASAASHISVSPRNPGSTKITVTATDPGGLSATLSFSALVRGFIAGSYDMDLILIDSMSAELETIFHNAADWWMTILGGTELADVPADGFGQLGCGGIVSDESVASIDELLIVISTPEMDGRGGALAAAGPCGVREESILPFMGVIRFDIDDLNWLVEEGLDDEVEEIILHEMGHVLGIGTVWSDLGLLREPSLGGPPDADTHFAGPLAVAAFDDAGGGSYEGAKVPVENEAGPGSGDSHWRQSVMVTELMTPYASIGVADPLSAITIQSLADLGYTADVGLADPYTLPGAAAALVGTERVSLADDVLRVPVIVVNEDGQVVGIARRN